MKENHIRFKRKHHPAEKSLIVFPLIPKSSSSLISSQKAHKFGRDKKVLLNFVEKDASELAETNADKFRELQSIRQTKVLIDSIDAQFPGSKKRRVRDVLSLPPINKKLPHSANLSRVHSMSETTFALPFVTNDKCHCSCSQKNEKLEKARLNRLAKLLRPEETPPMFSVYVRWKNPRNGTTEHNQDTLHEIFDSFGKISKILIKSRCSAIVTFQTIESACNAVRVMQRSVGKEMKLQVKWLNDMQIKSS